MKKKKQIKNLYIKFKKEFKKYFADINENQEAWKFIRNPFQCEMDKISTEV